MKYKFRRTAAAMLSLLLCSFYLCAAASASYSYPAIPDLDSLCSLTLDMGEPSVAVRIYRAAEVTADVRFILTGDFAGYPVDLENLTSTDWAALAQTLRSYVFLDDIQPLRTGVSDETGHIVFTDLPVGLYLVDGDRVGSAEEGYRQPAPFMICLPNWERTADPETGAESGGWQYSVSARPKYTTLDGGIIMRRVLKVWEDGGSVSRPAQISVSLLKDGMVYDMSFIWRHERRRIPYMLVEHGCMDRLVPFMQSVNFVNAIYRKLGPGRVEFVPLPNADHEDKEYSSEWNMKVLWGWLGEHLK